MEREHSHPSAQRETSGTTVDHFVFGTGSKSGVTSQGSDERVKLPGRMLAGNDETEVGV